MRNEDRDKFREYYEEFVPLLDLYWKTAFYYHRCHLKDFVGKIRRFEDVLENKWINKLGLLLQYFASQMVKQVFSLHERSFAHRRITLDKFVVRKSLEVHLMPSGLECEIGLNCNLDIWDDGITKKYKKKYLP